MKRANPALNLSHGKALVYDHPGQFRLSGMRFQSRKGSSVTHRELARGHQLLHRLRQAKQPQAVGDRSSAGAEPRGNFLMSHSELLPEGLIAGRDVHGI